MNTARSLARLLLLSLLVATPALAQSPTALGPRDGRGLPPTDLERVTVGRPAPDFALESVTGATIALSSHRGRKDVVLVFYRGHW